MMSTSKKRQHHHHNNNNNMLPPRGGGGARITNNKKKNHYPPQNNHHHHQNHSTFLSKVSSANQISICGASMGKVGRVTIRQLLSSSSLMTSLNGGAEGPEGGGTSRTTTTTPLFMIPIFQRRYCWNIPQWKTLLFDVERRKSSTMPHSLGRLTCTETTTSTSTSTTSIISSEADSSSSSVDGGSRSGSTTARRSCIIDGQQRFTTVTILLAAVRDVLLQYIDNNNNNNRVSSSNLNLDNTNIEMERKDGQRFIQLVDDLLFPDRASLDHLIRTNNHPPSHHHHHNYKNGGGDNSNDDDDVTVKNNNKEIMKNSDTIIHEGVELSCAILVPTYCDRWSYYAAVLPPHAKQVHSFPQPSSLSSTSSSSWHRPIQAKWYYMEYLTKSYTSISKLIQLGNSILDGLDMLYFPIQLGQNTNDGTEDLQVIYERLAVRDSTFCKPQRDTEYASMGGEDLIRNFILGSFRSQTIAIELYRTHWLPMEQRAAAAAAASVVDDNKNNNNSGGSSCSSLESMLEAFLKEQEDDAANEEEEGDSSTKVMLAVGPIGGQLYARFRKWLTNALLAGENCNNKNSIIGDDDDDDDDSSTNHHPQQQNSLSTMRDDDWIEKRTLALAIQVTDFGMTYFSG